MSWRLSPSYITGTWKPSSRLRMRRKSLLQWFPSNRSFITSRSPLSFATDDGASAQHGAGHGTIASEIPLPTAQSRTRPRGWREGQVVHARCAELLKSGGKAIDRVGGLGFANQIVSVTGTIKTIRKQKHGAFAHVTDGSCFQPIQVYMDPKLAAPLKNGVSLQVFGTWESSPAKGQPFELKATQVHIIGDTDIETYPVQKKYQTPEFLRTIPHLRIRLPFNSVLARFRSSCVSFLYRYIPDSGQNGGFFIQVPPPIITSSDCEGAGEVFTVVSNSETSKAGPPQSQESAPASFFRSQKYLTVSSQLHLEAYAATLRNVWALSPTFRAEKSDTPRHLAEFHMLEVEMSYLKTVRGLTTQVEELIGSLVRHLVADTAVYQDLLLALEATPGTDGKARVADIKRRWSALLDHRWMVATYSYCMKRLQMAAEAEPGLFDRPPQFGAGLQLEHERWIVEKVAFDKPIFVTHYPKTVKPFYMAPSVLAEDYPGHPDFSPCGHAWEHFDDLETGVDLVACFDLLLPFGVGEVAGGSLREHRLENLVQNMREAGMLKSKANQSSVHPVHATASSKREAEPYPFLQPGESLGALQWYADLRRYGTTPHGGFGIGWDRLMAYLTGVHNLRDVVPFPRAHGSAHC